MVKNKTTNRYWNGSSWQRRWIRYPVAVNGSPTSTKWSETISALDLTQGDYYLRAWTRATNGDGDPIGNAKANFTWQDRPSPVLNLAVSKRTDDTITVDWDSDSDDRRVSFDFFINNKWVGYIADPSATSHTFAGLKADTSYKLGVTSVGDRNLTYTKQWYSPRKNIDASTKTAGETVVFRDDFNSLNTNIWSSEHSTYGDGNNEWQCYLPRNVSVKDGKLVLVARKETAPCPNETRAYSSGMVRSKGVTFSPGQAIEFRVKLTPADSNNQAGLWPGVWASGLGTGGWPKAGEIDWLEVMTAANPRRSVYTIHYQQPDGKHGKKGKEVFGDENFSARWHTVRFEYGRNGNLKWYLDGDLVHSVSYAPTSQGWPAPFDLPVRQIKINFALGGNPGPLQDAAVAGKGATFEVDYLQITNMN